MASSQQVYRGGGTNWRRVLTHGLAQQPRFRPRVQLDQHGGHADDEHEQVGNRQVDQEQVGRVPQILGLDDDERHEQVAADTNGEDDQTGEGGQEAHVERKLEAVLAGRRRVWAAGRWPSGVVAGGRGPGRRPATSLLLHTCVFGALQTGGRARQQHERHDEQGRQWAPAGPADTGHSGRGLATSARCPRVLAGLWTGWRLFVGG